MKLGNLLVLTFVLNNSVMVKKSEINFLTSNYDITNLEKHLIYNFIEINSLDGSKSPILKKYYKSFEKDEQLLKLVQKLDISTIKELENYLELLIPVEDRKFNGAFFTPTFVVDFIIKELSPSISDKNLDPSCGCGAFLIGLVDYYRNTFNKSVKSILKENVYGSDILEYNISRAKLLLTIYGLMNNEKIEDSDFNLFVQDSLRANWGYSFNNIVGNPPYVKFQDLSDENRLYLIDNFKSVESGTFNLYFAFFELGYKLLTENGKLGYITPNNYFTSLSGISLRKYFETNQCVYRIVDFSHKKVFDAQTYTAITFLNKQSNSSILFDRILSKQSPSDFLINANGSPNLYKNLNIKKWRLLKKDEQKNIFNIENIGTPINGLFDIYVGIATLRDDLYFIDGSAVKGKYYIKNTANGSFLIEKSITKPVYKISDFKTQDELNQNNRRIICPYIIKDKIATAIPESDFSTKYPECYKYFLSIKQELVERDKAKVLYDPFYVWGRTQGLTKSGIKLLTPTFSQFPRFLIANDEEAFFTNGYGIFFKKSTTNDLFAEIISKIENIDVVQKILNSAVMNYYITKTSVSIEGGYPCYQKNFIERFTIPKLSQKEIELIRQLDIPMEIDQFLIKKYDLIGQTLNLA